jgi:hypothetical protein
MTIEPIAAMIRARPLTIGTDNRRAGAARGSAPRCDEDK